MDEDTPITSSDKPKPKKRDTLKDTYRRTLGIRTDEKLPVHVPRTPKGTFPKGQTGNPKGRPRTKLPDGMSFEEFFKDPAFRVIDMLHKLSLNPKVSDSVRLQAGQQFLDRALGKPKQSVDVTSTSTVQHTDFNFNDVDLEALRQVESAITRNFIEAQIIEDNREEPGDE